MPPVDDGHSSACVVTTPTLISTGISRTLRALSQLQLVPTRSDLLAERRAADDLVVEQHLDTALGRLHHERAARARLHPPPRRERHALEQRDEHRGGDEPPPVDAARAAGWTAGADTQGSDWVALRPADPVSGPERLSHRQDVRASGPRLEFVEVRHADGTDFLLEGTQCLGRAQR